MQRALYPLMTEGGEMAAKIPAGRTCLESWFGHERNWSMNARTLEAVAHILDSVDAVSMHLGPYLPKQKLHPSPGESLVLMGSGSRSV